jgi:acyl dehydratase
VTSAGQVLPSHHVRARNAATASENKIHDDTVARRYGFAGGLVPGITVFGYLTRPVVETWGQDWLERGWMEARFHRPIYDGDDVSVRGAVNAADAEAITAEVEAVNGAGDVCARARARLEPRPRAPSLDGYPTADLPAQRHAPTPEALARIDVLGTVEAGFHAGRADDTLALVGDDDLPLYRDLGAAHPTWLLYWANALLASNVALGPWIHTASTVQNHGVLTDGRRLSARGRVAALRERNGNHIVDHVLHTAIYRLRDAESRA